MPENDLKNMDQVIPEGTFTWGSFQYDATAAQYMRLCEQEKLCSRDAVLIEYGVKVGRVTIFDSTVVQSLTESLCIDLVDPEVPGSDDSEFRIQLKKVKTVVDMLDFLRDQAWDLWCAIPYLTRVIFPQLDLGDVCHEHSIGVRCWLLKSYNFVTDDEPFKEWDT